MRHALLLILLLSAGCIGVEADPPSLGPRDIEGVLDAPAYAIAPVASAEDPALEARIAELLADAERGENAFNAMLPDVRQTVAAAAGAPAESEAWIVAQLELSALGATRSPTTTALGALDEIYAHQTLDGTPAETEELLSARDRVATLYENQAERYDALAARLRSR